MSKKGLIELMTGFDVKEALGSSPVAMIVLIILICGGVIIFLMIMMILWREFKQRSKHGR